MRKQFLATIWRDNLGLYWPAGKLEIISCNFVNDGVWYININNEEYPAKSATKTLSQPGTDSQHAQVPVREGNVYLNPVAYPGPGFKETVRVKDLNSQRTFWVDKVSYDANVQACNDCCIPVECATPTPTVTGEPTDTEAVISIAYTGPAIVGFEYVVTPSGGEDCEDPETSGTITTADEVELAGLTAETEYCFCVRTICGPERYSAWVCIQFTTAEAE